MPETLNIKVNNSFRHEFDRLRCCWQSRQPKPPNCLLQIKFDPPMSGPDPENNVIYCRVEPEFARFLEAEAFPFQRV